MKYLITILLTACSFTNYQATAQITELKGEVGFKITTPAKQIAAKSTGFTLKLDRDGTAAFSVPVRSFQFNNNFLSDTLNEKLKTRFNDYYMESDHYPLITFSGNIPGLKLNKDGRYTRQGKGKLTTHGVSREIDFSCDIEVRGKQIIVRATAVFAPIYFNIRIPAYINGFYFRTVEIELLADNKQ